MFIFLVMLGNGNATVDGLEQNMQVNHLGHFLLTLLLEDKLKMAANEPNSDVRIVNVSCASHQLDGLDVDSPNFGLASWNSAGFLRHYFL